MTLMPPSPGGDSRLDETLCELLAPLPGPDPCGVSLREQALFTDIRLAREEDDPSLPMRQWERPLRQADWPLIESLCAETLSTRSKDLQLAAWLAEAWCRQAQGIAGLARGLLLLRDLVVTFWDGVHPRQDPPEEGGEYEARVAAFEWLDSALSHALRVHVEMLPLVGRKPHRFTLADWDRLVAGELSPGTEQEPVHTQADDEDPPLTREDILDDLARQPPGAVEARLAQVREARALLIDLHTALNERLDRQAPSLRRLLGVLDSLERVLLQVQTALSRRPAANPRAKHPHAQGQVSPGTLTDTGAGATDEDDDEDDDAGLDPDATAAIRIRRNALAPRSTVTTGEWHNREEAYQTLESLAAYLAALEPHSPTPYLIQRAVTWGRLPLPDLMAEILREEGDLNRMVQLLGLSR